MPECADVPTAVRDFARQLSEPQPMRRGTLSTQYLRCNKPGCACADRPGARPGPYSRVVRVVKGRTQSRHVPADRVDELRRQVGAGLGSVRDEALAQKLVDDGEVVYHLAAAAGVRQILDSPVGTIETNILGTDVIPRAAAHKRRRVVLASTSAVYGRNDRVPLSEDDDRSCACSKAIDEFPAPPRERYEVGDHL